MAKENLLTVKDLSISFGNKKQKVEVIHDISFKISENEIVGIVGESGSGKSVTSLAIMGLLPKKTSYIEGRLTFQEKNILTLKEKEFQKIRETRYL